MIPQVGTATANRIGGKELFQITTQAKMVL